MTEIANPSIPIPSAAPRSGCPLRADPLDLTKYLAASDHGDPLDLPDYLTSFGDAVLDAYRAGEEEMLEASPGLARSLMPPGSAVARDFSMLSPQIPDFIASACVGCMACVSICPDSAIGAVALPAVELDPVLAAAPETDRANLAAHFVETAKYGTVPVRAGLAAARFGLFIDPTKCKGCAECVAVCADLGHNALRMVEKSDLTQTAGGPPETKLGQAGREFTFFRRLPPTPAAYRNEKALADLMLSPDAAGYLGGAGSCAGCGEATALRMLVAGTRAIHGPDSMGIVGSTGCNSVFGATFPYNPYLVPWTNSLFENAATDAMGIRAAWEQEGKGARRLWVVGGDGAMYDIGFQALSRLVASGMDVKVLVLDTQVYSNTGGQSSTASFGGQVTKLSAYGSVEHGRVERRKELGRILIAHGEAYVAQTTPAHLNHFYRSISEANEYPGPAVVIVYAACLPEHGIPDEAAARQAKAAVDSRAFPLFSYDPRRGPTIAQRLSLQGNPSLKEDWAKGPDGKNFDFLSFARSEGRFAPHFAPDGTPSPQILATKDDRRANWRTLQELAGLPLMSHTDDVTSISRATDPEKGQGS